MSDGPRIRVAALILAEDGRAVFVRHRRGDSVYHLLPGGGVERGESLRDALMREVREETGLDIVLGAPLLLSDTLEPGADGRHVVNITFAADVRGGAITGAPEDPRVESVDLVAPADILALDLRPPIAGALLAALDEGCEGPARYLGPLWVSEMEGRAERGS